MRRSVIIPILHSSTAATSLAVPPSPDSHRPDGKLQRRNDNTRKNPFSGPALVGGHRICTASRRERIRPTTRYELPRLQPVPPPPSRRRSVWTAVCPD